MNTAPQSVIYFDNNATAQIGPVGFEEFEKELPSAMGFLPRSETMTAMK